jgi:hypothetical protein
MKIAKITFKFLLTTLLISFYACDNEALDSGLSQGNGDGEAGGESTGDYWPMAVNNNWIYDYSLDGVQQEDYNMTIDALSTFEGNQAYLYSQFMPTVSGTDGTELESFDIDFYTRKNGGDYIVGVGDLTADFLGLFQLSQTGYSFIILKDYLNVGETWTKNVQTTTTFTSSDPNFPDLPSVTTDLVLNFEIVAKDLTVDVNGTSYSPVIKVKYALDSSSADAPDQTIQADTFYYFAKDVGIIKIEGTQYDSGDNITSNSLQELSSYTLN